MVFSVFWGQFKQNHVSDNKYVKQSFSFYVQIWVQIIEQWLPKEIAPLRV